MRKKVKVILALAIVIMSLFANNIVSAYTIIPHGYYSANFSLNVSNTNYLWSELVDKGFAAWNNSPTAARITKNNNQFDRVMVSQPLQDSFLGSYRVTTRRSDGKATKFHIVLNDTILMTKGNNFIQSVIVHEVGHALSLGDNPGRGNTSVMNHSRDRNLVYFPKQDDINGVVHVYGPMP